MDKELLKIENLTIGFPTKSGIHTVVDHVNLEVGKGEIVGIVGESGSGKSMTSLAVMGLLSEEAQVSEGSIRLNGQELLGMSREERRKIQGRNMSMVFQEPMTSLNPVFTVGNQIMENILLHEDVKKEEAHERAVKLLDMVGISRPEKVVDNYPHQLSGGMRQRVMIAMALCCNPDMLICDEPTTALDVTIQAQILDLINELKEKTGTSVMMITHDLGVIAEVADDVMVMYAGKVVEHATCDQIFDKPMHPYTDGLMKCIPKLDDDDTKELSVIKGMVPSFDDMPAGCAFCPRCPEAREICRQKMPELVEAEGRKVRCFKYTKEWGENI